MTFNTPPTSLRAQWEGYEGRYGVLRGRLGVGDKVDKVNIEVISDPPTKPTGPLQGV